MKKFIFDLQRFAEESEQVTDTETVQESQKAPEDKEEKAEAKYTDAEVQKFIDKALAKEKRKNDEAQKLANMNAQERAEAERDSTKKELESLKREIARSKMSGEVRGMLQAKNINAPDSLVDILVTDDAETTKTATNQFVKLFQSEVQKAVKEALKGNAPSKVAGSATMSREQIMAIKDPRLRQQKIAENQSLFIK